MEGRAKVGYSVRDMMNAGSSTGHETRDGAVARSRLDEFDRSDEGHVDVIGRQFLDTGTSGAGDGFESPYGLLNGRNCDAHMVERKTVHESVAIGLE